MKYTKFENSNISDFLKDLKCLHICYYLETKHILRPLLAKQVCLVIDIISIIYLQMAIG